LNYKRENQITNPIFNPVCASGYNQDNQGLFSHESSLVAAEPKLRTNNNGF
jgi:hypothetical protein